MKPYLFPYQSGKFIIWNISILIFIKRKGNKAAKIIIKTNGNNGKCNNMGNKKNLNRDAKILKIKYQQRAVKLRCLTDSKAIVHKILFSATLPKKILWL